MKYIVTNIWWRTKTDEEFHNLPQRCVIEIEDYVDDIQSYLSNQLFDNYGYSAKDFDYEEKEF